MKKHATELREVMKKRSQQTTEKSVPFLVISGYFSELKTKTHGVKLNLLEYESVAIKNSEVAKRGN